MCVPGTDPWISIPGGSFVISDEHVEVSNLSIQWVHLFNECVFAFHNKFLSNDTMHAKFPR